MRPRKSARKRRNSFIIEYRLGSGWWVMHRHPHSHPKNVQDKRFANLFATYTVLSGPFHTLEHVTKRLAKLARKGKLKLI